MKHQRGVILVFVLLLPTILWFWHGAGQSTSSGTRQITPRILWQFEPPQRGGIVAGVTLHESHILTAVVRDAGLGTTSGVLYSLDRTSGRPRWSFDDQGRMLHTISTPLVVDTRVYVGEGLHGDVPCVIRSLSLETGQLVWQQALGGHIESSPIVNDELILVTAGDDGLQALDRATGKPRWNHRASGHIDAAPIVAGDQIIGGSAVSRLHGSSELFSLDRKTGKPHWRLPMPLPIWASPALQGDIIVVSLGNGRLTASEPPPGIPAGAVMGVDARTRQIRWRFDTSDGVMARPAMSPGLVHVACRDGYLHSLGLIDGREVWRHNLGSPIVAAPLYFEGRVYSLATGGQLACFKAETGELVWSYDFAGFSKAEPRLLSTPVVVSAENGKVHLFVGTELRSGAGAAAILFCLEVPGS